MKKFLFEGSFWFPERLIPSGWIEHAPFAYWLINEHRPRLLVELGTHTGYSYFVFNQALKRLNVEARCFAIDTWGGDEHAGYYGDEVFREVRAYNDKWYWDFSELIRSTFDEAIDRFADGTIDLLHIDGRHFYEDASNDFEKWQPKLSRRGIVLFHDTNVRVNGFGVHRLWDELKGKYPYFDFVHGHGLGIIAVGSEIPEALSELFAASADERLTNEIRGIYSRLGATLSERLELNRLSTIVTELTAQLNIRDRLIESKNNDIATRDDIILGKDKLLEERWDELQKLSTELTLRDELIARKNEDIAARDDLIQAKDKAFEERLVNFTAELAVRDKLILQRDEQITKKEAVIEAKYRKLEGVSDQLTRAESEIVRQYKLLASTAEELSATKAMLKTCGNWLCPHSDLSEAPAVVPKIRRILSSRKGGQD